MTKRLGHEPWDGETYYDQPPVKPSPFDWKVSAYVYVAGIGGSSQIIATMADRLGGERIEHRAQRPRRGACRGTDRATAADRGPEDTGAILQHAADLPLDLTHVVRVLILTGFGLFSALTAAGHFMGKRRRDGSPSGMRRVADMMQVPAAFLGAGMSTYTAALLSSTSTPVWSAAPEALAVQFGTSAMATAAATLSLGEQMTGNPENCRRLDALAAVAAAGELVAAGLAERRYRQAGVEGTLRHSTLGDTYKVGALAVGLGVPLACHAINALSNRPNRSLSVLGSLALLVGGAVMRQAIFQAGNKSAERPQDYFRLTEPRPGSNPRRRVDRDIAARTLGRLERVFEEPIRHRPAG